MKWELIAATSNQSLLHYDNSEKTIKNKRNKQTMTTKGTKKEDINITIKREMERKRKNLLLFKKQDNKKRKTSKITRQNTNEFYR
jgi:translation initiation factor 1 (eIF-1/SUI1)